MKITVFQEKQSQKWFYAFDKDWSTYRSNQGFDTKAAAEQAGVERWQSLIPSEKLHPHSWSPSTEAESYRIR